MNDANECFVAFTLTRTKIAEILNDNVDGELDGKGEFGPTDARLTAEFCGWFATEYGQILDSAWNADERIEIEEDLCNKAYTKLGIAL